MRTQRARHGAAGAVRAAEARGRGRSLRSGQAEDLHGRRRGGVRGRRPPRAAAARVPQGLHRRSLQGDVRRRRGQVDLPRRLGERLHELRSAQAAGGSVSPDRQAQVRPELGTSVLDVGRSQRGGVGRVRQRRAVQGHRSPTRRARPPAYAAGSSGSTTFGMGFVTDQAGGDTEKLFIAANGSSNTLSSIDTAHDLRPHRIGTLTATEDRNPELTGTSEARLFGVLPVGVHDVVRAGDRPRHRRAGRQALEARLGSRSARSTRTRSPSGAACSTSSRPWTTASARIRRSARSIAATRHLPHDHARTCRTGSAGRRVDVRARARRAIRARSAAR